MLTNRFSSVVWSRLLFWNVYTSLMSTETKSMRFSSGTKSNKNKNKIKYNKIKDLKLKPKKKNWRYCTYVCILARKQRRNSLVRHNSSFERIWNHFLELACCCQAFWSYVSNGNFSGNWLCQAALHSNKCPQASFLCWYLQGNLGFLCI